MIYFLFAILAIAWIWLRFRINEVESEVQRSTVGRGEFAALVERVYQLETLVKPPVELAAPAWASAAAAPPTASFAAPPRLPDAPSATAPPSAEAPPRREWEALIGGSVLNAVGAVVLVIGIALFLAYSFAHMTAAGRATLAALASITILGSGVWLEAKPRYRVFARGLIGAGWAAFYATAYAIYALPAARVVSNAAAGPAIQLAVAAGMVAHSLRYRAQAVTAIAYAAVFAALAVTPSTPFAVVSLVPIAGSALYLAARFEWDWMPLFGLAATYATCAARGESGASLASVQSLFFAYWLIFELFDLRRVMLRRVAGGLEFLFPLNAAGFLALSYLAWDRRAPGDLWLAAACGAALYLASSAARLYLRPASDGPLPERLREGSYEGSLLVAALLALLAILGRAPAVWAAAWLGAEAELLYLAGVRFDSAFLRWLGTGVFGVSLVRLLTTEPERRTLIFGHAFRGWTPGALFDAALFYCNRVLRPSALGFGYAASALVAVVLFAEAPHSGLGFAWVLFGCVLLELRLARGLREFEWQGAALIVAGSFAACAYVVINPQDVWWPLAAATAALFGCSTQQRPDWLTFSATACGAVLWWRFLPTEWVALAWASCALALIVAGLRRPGYALSLAALISALVFDLDPPRLAISIPTAALFYAGQFAARARGERRGALYESLLGTSLAAGLLWGRVSGGLFTVSWGLLGLSLLGAGFAARERSLRLQGLALLLICILKLFLWDLRNLETIYRILSFVALGLILLSVSWIYTRFRDQIGRLL